MAGLNVDQVLRLYDIETRQVHASLDHILRIRGMMALAFAAIFSATLIYRQGLIALGGLIFLGAWWWEYIYARYMAVYVGRVEQLQVWLAQTTQGIASLGPRYSSGYDHRITAHLATWVAKRLGSADAPLWFTTFFDLPRAMAYLAMTLSPLLLANLLGFPWVAG